MHNDKIKLQHYMQPKGRNRVHIHNEDRKLLVCHFAPSLSYIPFLHMIAKRPGKA